MTSTQTGTYQAKSIVCLGCCIEVTIHPDSWSLLSLLGGGGEGREGRFIEVTSTRTGSYQYRLSWLLYRNHYTPEYVVFCIVCLGRVVCFCFLFDFFLGGLLFFCLFFFCFCFFGFFWGVAFFFFFFFFVSLSK